MTTNIQRLVGGVVHFAAPSGMPVCEPNGRELSGYGDATSYRAVTDAVTCKRCLKTAPAGVDYPGRNEPHAEPIDADMLGAALWNAAIDQGGASR